MSIIPLPAIIILLIIIFILLLVFLVPVFPVSVFNSPLYRVRFCFYRFYLWNGFVVFFIYHRFRGFIPNRFDKCILFGFFIIFLHFSRHIFIFITIFLLILDIPLVVLCPVLPVPPGLLLLLQLLLLNLIFRLLILLDSAAGNPHLIIVIRENQVGVPRSGFMRFIFNYWQT